MTHPDPIVFNPGFIVIGLVAAGAYDITRWMAHCLKKGYEPWNSRKALNTIYIGVILGILAASTDPDVAPISKPLMYILAIPPIDEFLGWMRESYRRDMEREYVVSAREEDRGVEAVKQAYVEGDISILEFENQVEEEIELEEI